MKYLKIGVGFSSKIISPKEVSLNIRFRLKQHYMFSDKEFLTKEIDLNELTLYEHLLGYRTDFIGRIDYNGLTLS